ncbi:MAG: hypothetical protein ACI97N_001054 [Cognaticolwellia sp.]|jgi:hypothetical protein|tara:strand:+ start:41 stop:1063 length:1023 start_codon:yes stop_codon:yes gene_type:complete
MIFKEGNTVKFIHTGDIGEIVEVLDSETVMVLLDGDEIPADIENIVIWKNETVHAPLQSNKQMIDKKKPLDIKPKKLQSPKNEGLMVAYEPIFDNEGNINRFDIFLVNDTSYKVIYNFKIKILEYFTPEKNELIDPFMAKKIGQLSQYDLSDNPSMMFSLWQISTEGTGDKIDKTIKIKPKQFFKKVKNHSFTTIPCYTYEVLKKFNDKKEEDLKTYTKRNIKDEKEEEFYNYVRVHKVSEIEDRAEFPEEIDLHIERLTTNHKAMIPAEMLHLQIQVFEEYLDQAIRLGLPKVYIIHGMGKGRLRKDIQKKLSQNAYVRMYTNEHHPKYGFGATEVYLN